MSTQPDNPFTVAATATVCVQTGVDHWQDFRRTKLFTQDATMAMLDAWAKEACGPKATWHDLTLSPVEKGTP